MDNIRILVIFFPRTMCGKNASAESGKGKFNPTRNAIKKKHQGKN